MNMLRNTSKKIKDRTTEKLRACLENTVKVYVMMMMMMIH